MKPAAIAIAIFVIVIIGCSLYSEGDAEKENVSPDPYSQSKIFHSDTENSIVASEWEGFYETASKLCSAPPKGGTPCSDFKDCLRIKKSSDYYTVEFHSVQAYQNTCSAVLEMRDDRFIKTYFT